MKRDVISIDKEKCVGCSLCVDACHQGAIQLIDGKAVLVDQAHCDGLGRCLPSCPTDAIKIVQTEVDFSKKETPVKKPQHSTGGCPSSRAMTFEKKQEETKVEVTRNESQLNQWPCQLKLVSPQAPFFDGAKLLIAADCTAFAYANIHNDYMKDKVTVIGCPKLDMVDYTDKLTEIISYNNIESIEILRMTVPCCGIDNAVKNALIASKKMIPWSIVYITPDGKVA